MAIRTGLINGASNLNRDHQVAGIHQAVLSQGVIAGIQVTTGTVGTGTAIVQCTRTSTTPNETVFVSVDITATEAIDTSGTKKVWLKVLDVRVNDPSLNTLADGTGIATIETGVAYPASNYVPLAGIVGGVITDERTYAKISETGLANAKFKTVRVASTTDVSIASVNNGSIMDGITLVTGDNILLKDQVTTAQNGIYTVNNAGGLTRSILARGGDDVYGAVVHVRQGSLNAGKLIRNTNTTAITLGTTGVTFGSVPIDPSSQYQSIVLGGSYRAGDVVGVYNDAGTTKAEHPANWQRVVIGDAHSEVAAVNAQSRIVRVDFQRFIVSWVSTTVQLRCGTIASDGSISYGSTVNLSDSDASLGHMFLMADNTVGCTYRTSGGGTARMAILTLAGNVITVNNTGADKQINGSLGAGTLLGSGKIASNKVIAHYTVSGTSTRCAVATWTGTTFSAWTESNYVASAETGQTLGGNSVVTFPTLDDKCVFIANNTTSGTARVVTISGTTPTVNATVNVNSTVFSSGQFFVVENGNDRIFASYLNGSQTYSRVGTISGSTLTMQAEQGAGFTGFSATNGFIMTRIDDRNRYLIAGHNSSASSGALVWSVSGSTAIVEGFSATPQARVTSFGTLNSTAGTTFATGYAVFMRNGLALYGQHRATSTGVVQIGCQVEPARIYGIVQNTGVAGDTVSVALNGGISTAHTGLTAGTAYLTKFGYITTTTNSRILGEIISATNISVSPNSDYFNDSIVGSTLAGTSPWTFRNTLGKQLHCYLSGGTVSAVQLNTVNTAWSASHSFMLGTDECVTVTHSAAPTIFYFAHNT